MRKTQTFLAFAALLILSALYQPALAQTTAQQRAAGLRQQLADVQAKQMELETRLAQVEENSKPENIEKSLAGYGSTRPEELREHRRRQLEIEKNSLKAQLGTLASSKSRLEAQILQADADAYHQSAGVNADGTVRSSPATTTPQTGASRSAQPSRNKAARVRRSGRIRRNRARPRRVVKSIAPQ